jgi:protein O-GlcNAc transferase
MLAEKLREAFGRFNARDLAGTEQLCAEILRQSPRNPDALHLLGMARLMGGNAREAVSLIGRALEANPHERAALENIGLAHLVAGDPALAEAALRKALSLGAAHGLLYMRLALAVGSQGKLSEAVTLFETAAERAPNDPDVHLNFGNALAESGQVEAAVGCYRKVLALRPDHVDAHFNLGTLFKRIGRLDEAATAYRNVLVHAPDHAEAHNNLGLVYVQQGKADEAIACFRRALEFDPTQVQACNNLGNQLLAQGQRDQAVAYYEKARAAAPGHPDAYINLGNVRAGQGLFADAHALFEKVLQLVPRSVDAHRDLGRLLWLQGRREEGLSHLRRALEIDPSQADCSNDLGTAYRESGDLEAAEARYRKAIELDRSHVGAHYNLAETLKLQGRLDEAAALDERVLSLKGDYFPALGALIHLRQHMCAWNGIEKLWERLRHDAIGRPGGAISPFSILSQPTSPQEQLACAKAWAEQELAPLAAERARQNFDFTVTRRGREKLRVGYLSWDFHRHATAYLIAELFELHDRNRFEIYAYAFGPDDGSAIRARIRAACDRFIDVADQSYVATSQAIYNDGVDILIDLKGYTQGSRPQIMALRPAPIQVNWLGYPGTMGADCIDYIIADPTIIPDALERFYSEKVIRLADCYQINDRRREVSVRTPSRDECELPARGMVFCCFNLSYKILPEMFERWMRIMQAVPHSVLWLLDTNRWAIENLRRAAAAQGVSPERLVFAPRRPQAEHLARYRLADLALDTFPYTSHTTASDALWVGCPLVTCIGETFASRVAASLLINAGMHELVTESFEAYEQLVLQLAESPEKIGLLRNKLQAGRDSCALFDTPRCVKNLEGAYEAMFDRYASKNPARVPERA